MTAEAVPDRFSTPEVARLFRVDRKTAYRWLKAGRVSAIRLPGRGDLRISLDGIEVPDEPLLRVSEVARLFNTNPKNVTRWASKGQLPAIRMPSGRWRLLEGPVRERLDARAARERSFA